MCIVGFFGSSGAVTYGVTAEYFSHRLNTTSLQSSMLTSATLLSASLMCVPLTVIGRVYGGRIVLAVVCLLCSASLFVSAAVLQWVSDISSLYGLFVVLSLVTGCGPMVISPGIIQACWWWPGKYQGGVAGFYLLCVTAGPATFGGFANPFAEGAGMPALFLFWGLCLLLTASVALGLCWDPPYYQVRRAVERRGWLVAELPGKTLYTKSTKSLQEPALKQITQEELRTVCRVGFSEEEFPEKSVLLDLANSVTHLESWCIIAIASTTLGSVLALAVWVPTFVTGVYNTSPVVSGYVLLGVGYSGAIGCFLGGFIADRLNVWILAASLMVFDILCFVCIGLSTNFALTVAALVCVMFGCGFANTCSYKIVLTFGSESVGGTIGWMEMGGNMLGFVFPIIFGAIASNTLTYAADLRLGMAVPASLLTFSLLLLPILYMRIMRKRKRKQQEQQQQQQQKHKDQPQLRHESVEIHELK